MWFRHREIRRLLVEAGGPYRPGDKLKMYWYNICEDLVIYTDTEVRPRTLEDAWRGRGISKKVRAALESLVAQKKKARAKEHDSAFIADVKKYIQFVIENDPTFPRQELAILSAFSVLLERTSALRTAVDDQLDRIASCRARIELAEAVSKEAAE